MKTTHGHYTLLDEMMASPTEPLPLKDRLYTVSGMQQALFAIKVDPHPSVVDWRVLSDMVNLMHTLVDMGELEDGQNLLRDAMESMVDAANRHKGGHTLRFDGPGVRAMTALFEDYSQALDALPARTMIRCHRLTEKRMRDIRSGKKRLPTDVLVEV